MDTIFVDFVRYAHLLAVAVGLGAAAMADYAAFTGLRRKVSEDFLTILKTSHTMIWPAVIVMWVTGIALIGIRTGFELQAFTPKLFAKLFVVTALTLNAVAIGRIGMGLIARDGGLKALKPDEMRRAALMGGVSSASWLFALALGSSRFLAEAPASLFLLLIPLVYLGAVFAADRVLWALRDEPTRHFTTRKVDRIDRQIVAMPARDDDGVRSYKIGLFPRRATRAA